MSVATSQTTIDAVGIHRGTGAKHRAAILAVLADGALETVDIAAALKIDRRAALLNLRALERQGVIAEAFRKPRRTGAGRHTIVWKLAR